MEMHALILSTDQSLSFMFGKVTNEFAIKAQITAEVQAASDEVSRAKYDAIVLDFDTVADAFPILGLVRGSRSNKAAVIFAVATDKTHSERASRESATVLLHRPIDITQVRRALSAAHGFMLMERRHYFRCAVELVVLLTRSDSEKVPCTSMNISNSGMGIKAPIALTPGEILKVTCMLPGGVNFAAIGKVVWDDRHGKSGLRFESIHSEMQNKLESWLDSQFSTGRIPTPPLC